MKRILFTILVLMMAPAFICAQSIVGTKHDLGVGGGTVATDSVQVCVFCHTPHGSATAANQVIPLWNKVTTAASFTMYNQTNNPNHQLQGVVDSSPTGASIACLTCHDGTLSVAAVINPEGATTAYTVTAIASRIDATGKIISNSNMGTDLTNDHPISITYLATDTGLNNPTGFTANTVQLFPSNAYNSKVQCASCHEVHSNTISPFLRKTMVDSALCTECHAK